MNNIKKQSIHKKRKDLCQFGECNTVGYFGPVCGPKRHCSKHRVEGEVDLVTKRCSADNCQRGAYYGIPGGKRIHCSIHSVDGEIDLCTKRCLVSGCTLTAGFGPRGKKRVRCLSHALPGDINLVAKICQKEGCNTHATFAKEGERPRWCKQHKQEGDINTSRTKSLCRYHGCKTQPVFGPSGTATAVHCAKHKQEGEEDVRSRFCQYAGCQIRASYGVEGEQPRFCGSHRQSSDRHLSGRCRVSECWKTAIFGFEGERPAFCAQHKKSGQQNLVSHLCSAPNCKKQPLYGEPGGLRVHCSKHKEENEEHLARKECSMVGCSRFVHSYHDKLTDGLCVHCCPWYEVTSPRETENLCVSFLGEQLRFHYCNDKTIERHQPNVPISVVLESNRRYRPDWWITAHRPGGTCRIIIVEIDEYGHSGYDPEEEVMRMEEIARACKEKPQKVHQVCICDNRVVVFIRFNPHNSKTWKVSFEERLARLWKEVDSLVALPDREFQSVEKFKCVKLFYNH